MTPNQDQIIDATMARSIQADAARTHPLLAWVIVRNEAAYPGQFVARLVTDAITTYVLLADTLGELHAKLPPGLVRSDYQPAGPGIVVEVWFPSGGRRWHQLDRPIRRSAHCVLTQAGAQIDRGRGPPALPAPQLGSIWIDRLPTTAMQFQAIARPVQEALVPAERGRAHRSRLFLNVQGTTGSDDSALLELLAAGQPARHLLGMYVVTEADAAAIRQAYETGGEVSVAVELRRRFLGIIDNATAREQARRIAAWTPLPDRPKRVRKGKGDG